VYVFELVGEREDHPVYEELAVANLARQYDFLRSLVQASLQLNRPMIGLEVVKALNYHAISCLHAHAGEIRPCQVYVGDYTPPAHHRVPALMSIVIDDLNRWWDKHDPVYLAAYVLWRLNWIHPFINGNGRTARVAAYYVICLSMGGWLPGEILLPDLLRRERAAYVAALQAADASLATGSVNLTALHALLQQLLNEQLEPFVSPDEAGEPTT
jgi:Fic family protein